MERKEYQNRQDTLIVNPPITNDEYEKERSQNQEPPVNDEVYHGNGC